MSAIGLALLLAVLAAGCQRPSPLVTERDERLGVAIQRPAGWTKTMSPDGTAVRYVPPQRAARPEEAAEFIAVFSIPADRPPTDAEIRRLVFSVLPIHGVSGFVQERRSTAEVLWYRFEVTGLAGGTEWASVGRVAAGPGRVRIAVCAKPLAQWRAGQRECDAVMRTFQPL